jgi:hypothetical protein
MFFIFYFVWLLNAVCHILERTQIEDIWEQGAEENICI